MKEDVSVPSLWFYRSGRLWGGQQQRLNVLQPKGQPKCAYKCPVDECECVFVDKAPSATSEARVSLGSIKTGALRGVQFESV